MSGIIYGPDGRGVIHNPDGSVYMTFPPVTPRTKVRPLFTVREISTGSHSPGCCHSGMTGTFALSSEVTDQSMRDVFEQVGALVEAYGYRPRPTKMGRTADGRTHYRWSWEDSDPQHRGTHMLIASVRWESTV